MPPCQCRGMNETNKVWNTISEGLLIALRIRTVTLCDLEAAKVAKSAYRSRDIDTQPHEFVYALIGQAVKHIPGIRTLLKKRRKSSSTHCGGAETLISVGFAHRYNVEHLMERLDSWTRNGPLTLSQWGQWRVFLQVACLISWWCSGRWERFLRRSSATDEKEEFYIRSSQE